MQGGPEQQLKPGLCWDCNYPLRGIESRRCPECGRAFDPVNPDTMNLGQPRGPIGRWAVRPLSWPLVAAAIVATALVLTVTRWPTRALYEWFVDLPIYLRWGDWRMRWAQAGWRDVVYSLGLFLWIVVLVGWWVGALVRAVAVRRYRAAGPAVRAPSRHRIMFALLALTIVMVGIGWPFRLGQAMVTHELAFARSNPSTIMGWLPIPDPESGRTRQALWSVALHGSTTRERLTAFRVLIERDAIFAPTVLDDALSRETDPIMKAWELRLIGFHRGTKQSEQIGKFLDDPNPSVRAAAADALGMMYGGTGNGQLLQDPYMGSYPTTISDPPMALIETRPYTHFVRDVGALVATMPDALRSRLQRMMIEGDTIEDRQSAARAIVGYAPPDYRLRLAEWGVWLAGADDGRLQSVLSDIPAFVHATGDSAQSVQALAQAAAAKRRGLPIPIVTTKPVIHLTASVPISLDLKVSIRSGRPWYVYPRPDEFMFDHAVQSNTPLVPAGLKELAPELHSGYDWLVPSFPTDGTSSPARSPTGLRWQNLIVTPTRQPWMQPASVNDDAKYAWWTQLRNVDCSWISNREESERFLYYDGPTVLRCPVQFAWENDGLVVRQVERNAATQFFGAGAPQTRVALLLHVENGKVEAEQLQIPITNGPFNYKWPVTPEGQKVDGPPDAAFFKLITRGGLTTSEATGMLECWRKPFFQNDGVRLLMFLSAKDYETVCSVTVKPAPTESARVGIIWAELK